MDPADAARCVVCRRPWTDVDAGRGWLHLEVTRHGPAGDPDVLDVDVCTQKHAAEWLRRPLPDPVAPEPYRMSWRDRAGAAALGLGLGVPAALAGLGLVTAVRFLVERI